MFRKLEPHETGVDFANPLDVAAIWDGDRWAFDTLLDTTVITTTVSKCFDAAYESLSGDLLVAYGHRPIVEETRYATRDARTGIWTVQQAHSTDSIGTVFRLAPDGPFASMTIIYDTAPLRAAFEASRQVA